MPVFKDIDALAGMGSNGRWPNNCHRDMMNVLAKPRFEPLGVVEIPVKRQNAVAEHVQMGMAYPHAVFASMYHSYKDSWTRHVVPSEDALRGFWHDQRDNPQMAHYPESRTDRWRTRAVPISIHGDGVPAIGEGKIWQKLIDIYTWTSFLAEGTNFDVMFMIFCLFRRIVSIEEGMNTKMKMWATICWSLYFLNEGWVAMIPHVLFSCTGRPWEFRSDSGIRNDAHAHPISIAFYIVVVGTHILLI